MKLSQGLQIRQEQRLAMTPEMLMSLNTLTLPVMDLREEIHKQVNENPALEILDERNFRISKRRRDKKGLEIDRYTQSTNYGLRVSSYSNPHAKDPATVIEEMVNVKINLNDWLIWQFDMLEFDQVTIDYCASFYKKNEVDSPDDTQARVLEIIKEIGHTIIFHIDNNGFFQEDLALLFPDNLKIAELILDIIQSFEPVGVAQKDVQAALIFQIESQPEVQVNQLAYKIVQHYFDFMAERRDGQLAKTLEVPIDEIKEALVYISQFQPYPGRAYEALETSYIVPDAFVDFKDGEIIVEINDEIIPSLVVSKALKAISEEKEKVHDEDGVQYAIEKVRDAQSFIDMLHHRNTSLKKLIMAISVHQAEFFRRGPKYLLPLTMRVIADEINLSESTISRLSSSKYLQTPWGLHPIRYFFTNSITKGDDEAPSAEATREYVKEIIEKNSDVKLSDQKIATILKENYGINIARRTIQKYRTQLQILPSTKRNI